MHPIKNINYHLLILIINVSCALCTVEIAARMWFEHSGDSNEFYTQFCDWFQFFINSMNTEKRTEGQPWHSLTSNGFVISTLW